MTIRSKKHIQRDEALRKLSTSSPSFDVRALARILQEYIEETSESRAACIPSPGSETADPSRATSSRAESPSSPAPLGVEPFAAAIDLGIGSAVPYVFFAGADVHLCCRTNETAQDAAAKINAAHQAVVEKAEDEAVRGMVFASTLKTTEKARGAKLDAATKRADDLEARYETSQQAHQETIGELSVALQRADKAEARVKELLGSIQSDHDFVVFKVREQAIEECARVADREKALWLACSNPSPERSGEAHQIAAFIRALTSSLAEPAKPQPAPARREVPVTTQPHCGKIGCKCDHLTLVICGVNAYSDYDHVRVTELAFKLNVAIQAWAKKVD